MLILLVFNTPSPNLLFWRFWLLVLVNAWEQGLLLDFLKSWICFDNLNGNQGVYVESLPDIVFIFSIHLINLFFKHVYIILGFSIFDILQIALNVRIEPFFLF